MDLTEHGCFKDHPKVERENVVKFQQRVWKELHNCGKDVPKGRVNVQVYGHQHTDINMFALLY